MQQGLLDPPLEAPVHVVIKSPCIAVRYPISPSSVSSTSRWVSDRSSTNMAVGVEEWLFQDRVS